MEMSWSGGLGGHMHMFLMSVTHFPLYTTPPPPFLSEGRLINN